MPKENIRSLDSARDDQKQVNLLASVSDISTDSEFFSPMPEVYKKGKDLWALNITQD